MGGNGVSNMKQLSEGQRTKAVRQKTRGPLNSKSKSTKQMDDKEKRRACFHWGSSAHQLVDYISYKYGLNTLCYAPS